MKKIIPVILIMFSVVLAQSGLNIIGGITNSTIATNIDVDFKTGLRAGLYKTLNNGLIVGATYSQRGYSIEYNVSDYKYDEKFTYNYLTGFVLNPIPILLSIDFLIGIEGGYFISGEINQKSCINEVRAIVSPIKFKCEKYTEKLDSNEWVDSGGNRPDIGLVLGARYPINKNMYFYGTCYYGLYQLVNDIGYHNRGFQIDLSYRIK